MGSSARKSPGGLWEAWLCYFLTVSTWASDFALSELNLFCEMVIIIVIIIIVITIPNFKVVVRVRCLHNISKWPGS